MTKPSILMLCCAQLCLAGCSDGASGPDAIPASGEAVSALVVLDDAMRNLLYTYDIPGAALAVTRRGRLVYARGFGYADVEAGTLVQPGSLFRIASVSKAITGMAVNRLIQEGRLSLSERVFGPTGILDDAGYQTIQDRRVLDIEVGHLLAHIAGFPGEGEGDPQFDSVPVAAAMGVATPPEAVTVIQYVLAKTSLLFAPGTRYLYSNVGFNVLGRIIEKRSGMTYEAYVRSLLAEIGVTDMVLAGSLESGRRAGEVKYYDLPWCAGAGYDGTANVVPCSYGVMYMPTIDSHGGWIASPIDLLKFSNAVDGFGNHPSLLSEATITTMKRPPAGVPGAYGYSGWNIDANDNWARAGALTTGTAAMLYRGADQTEWAVIFNRLPFPEGGRMDDISAFFAKVMAMTDILATVTDWPTGDQFVSD